MSRYFNRAGVEINRETWALLRSLPEYIHVRHFINMAGVESSIIWHGHPDQRFVYTSPRGTTRWIGNETTAIQAYEDGLAAEGCGEWVQKEDGTTYFLEHFNDSPFARNPAAETDLVLLLEQRALAPVSKEYGSW